MQYVHIHSKLLDNPIYRDSKAVHLWVHLLLVAEKQPRTVVFMESEYKLSRGQLVTSSANLALQTGIKVEKILSIIEDMKAVDMISVKPKTGSAIIEILNFNKYQPDYMPIDNDKLTKEQVNRIISSWKKVSPKAFEIKGEFSVGMVISQQKRLTGKTISEAREIMELFDIYLNDNLYCEKFAKKTKAQLDWEKLHGH